MKLVGCTAAEVRLVDALCMARSAKDILLRAHNATECPVGYYTRRWTPPADAVAKLDRAREEEARASSELRAALDALRTPLVAGETWKQLQVEPEVSLVLDAVSELRRMLGREAVLRERGGRIEGVRIDIAKAERALDGALRTARAT